MNDRFSLLDEKLSFSKITLFLSFQIAQRRLGGAAFPIFLAFFLIGKVVHPSIKSFIMRGQAQSIPGKEMRVAHRPHTAGQ